MTSAVAELEARVAQHASVVQVEDLNGATSTATWWAAATRQTRVETFRKVHLAAGLEKYGSSSRRSRAGTSWSTRRR
ncbi:MAG: hypothetical protein ACXVEJ_03540 [Nocardioides sp.]